MSTEFFSTMSQIEEEAKTIKFLEGSHPELYVKHRATAENILDQIKDMRMEINTELLKKSKSVKAKRKNNS